MAKTLSAKDLLSKLSATVPLELSIEVKQDGQTILISLAEFLAIPGVIEGIGADGSINLRDNSGQAEDLKSAAMATDLAAIEVINTGIQTDSTKIKRFGYMSAFPTMGPVDPASTGDAQDAQQRIGFAEATLVGGSLADVPLVPAKVGKSGVLRPIAVWADSVDTYIFTFEDSDNAALEPVSVNAVDVDLKHANEVAPFGGTHGVAGDNSGAPSDHVVFRGAADNRAIEVDLSGGAGGEHVVLWYIYHYE